MVGKQVVVSKLGLSSLNLVRFIACLQIVSIWKVDPPFLGSMKLNRAKLRQPAVCRHWQNHTLGHQSHCPCRILPLESVRLREGIVIFSTIEGLPGAHPSPQTELRRSCRVVVLCSNFSRLQHLKCSQPGGT